MLARKTGFDRIDLYILWQYQKEGCPLSHLAKELSFSVSYAISRYHACLQRWSIIGGSTRYFDGRPYPIPAYAIYTLYQHEVCETSIKQIAEVLKKSENEVEQILFQARQTRYTFGTTPPDITISADCPCENTLISQNSPGGLDAIDLYVLWQHERNGHNFGLIAKSLVQYIPSVSVPDVKSIWITAVNTRLRLSQSPQTIDKDYLFHSHHIYVTSEIENGKPIKSVSQSMGMSPGAINQLYREAVSLRTTYGRHLNGQTSRQYGRNSSFIAL